MQKEWWSQRGEAAERNKKQDYLSEVFFSRSAAAAAEL